MACQEPAKFFPAINTPALPKGSMKGKIALVTGGGTGIGRGIATMFASLGAKVAIAARRMDVLEKTAAEIRAETGGVCEAFQLDVKQPDLIKKALDDIEKKFGGIPNVLVNNAAGNFIMASQRLSPNAIKAVVDIVLMGSVAVTTELGRRAIERGTGCAVLSISAGYARAGAPFVMPSAMSKSGVEIMTKSLATEWAKYGFRFNVISPGPVPTHGAFGRLSTISFEDAVELAGQTVPTGRCGTVEEVANLAAFMCSDYGNWLNGAIIDLDGGQQHFNHGSSMGAHLHQQTDEEWKAIEAKIRSRTGKTKSKM